MTTATMPVAPAPRRTTRSSTASKHRRTVANAVMLGLLGCAALVAVLPLIFILFYLFKVGFSSINLAFFTHGPVPVGETGGGMGNAIVGTIALVGMACVIGVPVGVGAGIYLAEFRGGPLATAVRFLSDVLNGLPSIVIGIFAWALLVRPVHHFSALSGGVALGAMMIPLLTRTTEELIRTVPNALREAALALGYPRWRTSLTIVLRTALPGIVTGALVAVARRGRDGAAPVHGVRQPVLVARAGAADRGDAAADLQLRDQPLRRVARAGVGGRARAAAPHLRPQRRRPLRDAHALRRRW